MESKVSPKLPNTGSKWDTIKRLYNENKDNKVSWAELIKAEPNLNTEHMKKVFKQIAGADGLASYNDYAKFISKADKAVKPKETLWERVRRLYDENKDSKVSWKELIRAQPKLNNWRMRRTFKSIAGPDGLASYSDYEKFYKIGGKYMVKLPARNTRVVRRL